MPRTLSYSNASSSGGGVDLSSIDLSSKANVSDVNALTTRVDTAETNINDLETIVTGSGDSDFTLTNVTQVTPNTSGVGFGGGADGEYPTGGGNRLFDNNVQSDYVILKQGTGDIPSPQNIFYLTYDHGADVIINRYRLFRHSSTSPQSWTFEASTDNVSFVTLDTTYQNSNLSNPSYSGNSPEDNVANANSADFNSSDTAYRYYRFGFTGANGGADELKISELQFFRVQITTRNVKNVLDDLETDLGSLTTTVNGKASQADLDALENTVAGLGGASLSYVQVRLTTNTPQTYSGFNVQPQYNQTIQSSDNIFTVESTRHKIHVPAGTYLVQFNLSYNLNSVASGNDQVGMVMRIAGADKMKAVNSHEGHDDYGHIFSSKVMTFTASSTKLEFYYFAGNITFQELAYPADGGQWAQIIKIA